MILKVTAFCKGFHSLHLWLNPDKAIKKMKNSFQQCGVFLGEIKLTISDRAGFTTLRNFPLSLDSSFSALVTGVESKNFMLGKQWIV